MNLDHGFTKTKFDMTFKNISREKCSKMNGEPFTNFPRIFGREKKLHTSKNNDCGLKLTTKRHSLGFLRNL